MPERDVEFNTAATGCGIAFGPPAALEPPVDLGQRRSYRFASFSTPACLCACMLAVPATPPRANLRSPRHSACEDGEAIRATLRQDRWSSMSSRAR